MNPKKITILGSTGSIGRSTLEVVDNHPGRFEIIALAAYSNWELLAEQFHKYRPKKLCLIDRTASKKLADKLDGQPVEIVSGEDGLIELAGESGAELVLNAVVGSAGLRASLATIKSDKDLALANKESLVSGGPLFPPLLEKSKGRILPVDSEHSAIWQAINGAEPNEVSRIILTASGGPFRTWSKAELQSVTLEQALNHPTWKMGPKITIDSATLVNKGLEVIEAVVLFDLAPEKIEVLVHPQSIIHSMVEFVDSSVLAQLSNPDMRLPINYALFWPERAESAFGRIDFAKLQDLTFEQPDYDKFPALELAFEAARLSGTAPAIYSAANEVAVEAFLNGAVRYVEIAAMIEKTLERMTVNQTPSLDEILAADNEARRLCKELMEKAKC